LLTGAPEMGRPFFWTELKMEQKKAARAPKNRRKLIRALLTKIEKEFKNKEKETKATVADFIRLTQLERELEEQDQPREIIITWAEPAEKYSVER
jgi:hypothetical protein